LEELTGEKPVPELIIELLHVATEVSIASSNVEGKEDYGFKIYIPGKHSIDPKTTVYMRCNIVF